MKPWLFQEQLSDVALAILRQYGMVYLAMEERTGKTLTAILTAEKSLANNILVITKKTALEGWHETLEAYDHLNQYTVTNYHQAHKHQGEDYDLVILDEAHNYISAFPKVGGMWNQILPLVLLRPIIYMSATPHAQGPQMLYHQFALSSWSPWKRYRNFYQWFKDYGHLYQIEVQGLPKNKYDRCEVDLIMAEANHLFISKTRKELGFDQEPEDIVHFIELDEETKHYYNTVITDEMVQLPGMLLICDTKSKMRFSLHQLEGGTMKMENVYKVLGNTEKIQFILENFGDTEDLVIMYNYQAEETKLYQYFNKARILQATSYAEGVDLHKHEHLIIYSQDFSTARHTQRRARQANNLRATPIKVHYLLVKKAISEQAYKTVSKNKKNFVDSVFTKETL